MPFFIPPPFAEGESIGYIWRWKSFGRKLLYANFFPGKKKEILFSIEILPTVISFK